MIDEIKVFKHASVKIKNIYVDPYKIDSNDKDAKYIFITHDHYDHYSIEDIDKIINEKTILIMPLSMKEKNIYNNDTIYVEPNKNYILEDISFKTMPMYNIDKQFHKKENNWCGYNIKLDNNWIYIVGDSDNIPEFNNITCDIIIIPIGGTYTMDVNEAILALDNIKYNYVIPYHYGTIVGDISLGITFKEKVGDKCILKIK